MDFGTITLLLFWGTLVGLVFSLVGAAGGILASFGLITLIGVTDPNSIKPMAQILSLATALVFIPGYIRRKSTVIPLALMLSAGGVMGAIVGSTLSSRYLSDMSTFKPLFGILTLIIAVQIIWEIYKLRNEEKVSSAACEKGVHSVSAKGTTIKFSYADKDFKVSLWTPWLAGFFIAIVASAFGVGGGFLLVPFMVSFLRMPMFIIPATAAVVIFISGSISVTNYLRMGAEIDWTILSFLIAGGVVGALIGPRINRIMQDSWLRIFLATVLSLIGLKYALGI
ncbi:MAG TPA: sulfite exporter TauE/SafE family protein [Leucothrix mucor]|nr:sulfite exporter TauE/SafE family protein [Leucothrix mucor]